MTQINRREIIGLGAITAVGIALAAKADDVTLQSTAVEVANREIIRKFCAALASLDMAAVYSLVADDIVYQAYDNVPLTQGMKRFRAAMDSFTTAAKSLRIDVSRTAAIGPIVLNERVDSVRFREPNDTNRDADYKIAGVFQLAGGKIKLWYDFARA